MYDSPLSFDAAGRFWPQEYRSPGSPPRRSESARPAARIGQIALFPLYRLVARHNHLGDAGAGVNRVWLASQVQQDHANLATIPRVDGARRIGHGDGMVQSQPAARPHLRFAAHGRLDDQAGGDQPRDAWLERDV